MAAATGLPVHRRRLRPLRGRAQRHARDLLRALGRQARRRRGEPRPAARPALRRARRAPRRRFVVRRRARVPGPDGRRVVEEGRIDGMLLHERHGDGGFGYDPIFRPHGYDVSTAELPADEKNRHLPPPPRLRRPRAASRTTDRPRLTPYPRIPRRLRPAALAHWMSHVPQVTPGSPADGHSFITGIDRSTPAWSRPGRTGGPTVTALRKKSRAPPSRGPGNPTPR